MGASRMRRLTRHYLLRVDVEVRQQLVRGPTEVHIAVADVLTVRLRAGDALVCHVEPLAPDGLPRAPIDRRLLAYEWACWRLMPCPRLIGMMQRGRRRSKSKTPSGGRQMRRRLTGGGSTRCRSVKGIHHASFLGNLAPPREREKGRRWNDLQMGGGAAMGFPQRLAPLRAGRT